MLKTLHGFSVIAGCLLYLSSACQSPKSETANLQIAENKKMTTTNNTDTATLAGGCFWCVEAIYQDLKGVISVTSGYSGGARPNPTYEQVCSGATGHAEAAQIVYDPKQLTFDEILEVFWSVHDPTTFNQQGADIGTQYRSAVFYHDEKQKETAEKYKKRLNDEKAFDNPVITEITAFTNFYPAEKYHQNYYKDNGDQPYCSLVIRPKVEKFRKAFHDKLKNK